MSKRPHPFAENAKRMGHPEFAGRHHFCRDWARLTRFWGAM